MIHRAYDEVNVCGSTMSKQSDASGPCQQNEIQAMGTSSENIAYLGDLVRRERSVGWTGDGVSP